MGWVEYEPFYSTTYQHGQQQLHYWKTDRKGEKLSWGITSRFWFGGVLVQDHTESSRQSEFPTRWKMGRPLPTIAIEQTTSGGKREWRLRSSKRSSRKENLYMETSFCRSKFIPRRKNVRHHSRTIFGWLFRSSSEVRFRHRRSKYVCMTHE
jgi:hypothetical protein